MSIPRSCLRGHVDTPSWSRLPMALHTSRQGSLHRQQSLMCYSSKSPMEESPTVRYFGDLLPCLGRSWSNNAIEDTAGWGQQKGSVFEAGEAEAWCVNDDW